MKSTNPEPVAGNAKLGCPANLGYLNPVDYYAVGNEIDGNSTYEE